MAHQVTEIADEAGSLREPVDVCALDAFNCIQLRYIYLGLTRLEMAPKLKEATDSLALSIESLLEWDKGE